MRLEVESGPEVCGRSASLAWPGWLGWLGHGEEALTGRPLNYFTSNLRVRSKL